MAVCDRRGANYFPYLIKINLSLSLSLSLSLNKKCSIRSGILLTADGADADIAPTSKLCSSGLRSAGLPKQAARRTRAARRPVSWPAAASDFFCFLALLLKDSHKYTLFGKISENRP
jgi:hypothetical protein